MRLRIEAASRRRAIWPARVVGGRVFGNARCDGRSSKISASRRGSRAHRPALAPASRGGEICGAAGDCSASLDSYNEGLQRAKRPAAQGQSYVIEIWRIGGRRAPARQSVAPYIVRQTNPFVVERIFSHE